jgi:hypothetical protein
VTGTARCPVCDEPLPARDRPHGGRNARYCSGACKARAYRARQQAGETPAGDLALLPPGGRHARVIEIRQQVSELAGMLADTASGQQTLFAAPGATRRIRPAETGRALHRLIAELTMLAATATVAKRAAARPQTGAPRASPLFEETGLNDA